MTTILNKHIRHNKHCTELHQSVDAKRVISKRQKYNKAPIVLILSLVTIVLMQCTTSNNKNENTAKPLQLTLVSYAVTKEAYSKIIPLFQASWKETHNQDIQFVESYGGSGSQAQAVINGLDADIVHLAMQTDIDKIAESGLIDKAWQTKTPDNGIVAKSLIVMAVRPGNPRHILDWWDASQKGVGVITPNPKSSGGARWNLLAVYGASLLNGGSDEQAYSQVKQFYSNTLVLDKNARDATTTFLKKGIGDIAALWESDALLAKAEGEQFDIIIPQSSILAETAVAVVDSVTSRHGTRAAAQAFVNFLFSEAAQTAFADAGLRPVSEQVMKQYAAKYPVPQKKIFEISSFGGWASAQEKFFGKSGLYSKIESEIAAGN